MSRSPNSGCESPVIVALDFSDQDDAMALVERLSPAHCRLKVGKQLFTSAGPKFVRILVDQGYDVFLDLKFHDIPNTVAGACAAAADLGVWMLNVHASGGRRMLDAAKESIDKHSLSPKLIAVSVLTSMSEEDLRESGVERSLTEQVLYLSKLAFSCGLDGMVCSAQEATLLKEQLPKTFCLVTPGIRTLDSEQGDQRRVMTPELAAQAGADYLVIGRSITGAAEPLQALQQINQNLGVSL